MPVLFYFWANRPLGKKVLGQTGLEKLTHTASFIDFPDLYDTFYE